MQFPISTGLAAKALSTTEPALNALIRRGKISPAPPVVLGRRQWSEKHLRAAAHVLGVHLKPFLEVRER